MVRLGIHRKCWSEFLCLGGYIYIYSTRAAAGIGSACGPVLPRRAKLGVPPAGAMRSVDTPPPAPAAAGAPPAGPWQEPDLPKLSLCHNMRFRAGYCLFILHDPLFRQPVTCPTRCPRPANRVLSALRA
jgi:hypothetical protein